MSDRDAGEVDMSAAAVDARLRTVSELADLDPERRMDAKIDYSAQAVDARLRMVAMLRASCLRLGEDGGPPGST